MNGEVPPTRRQRIEIVDISGLKRLDSVQDLGSYCRDLWQRRSFIYEDAKGRAFRTTRDYRWWRFWIVASPLLDALMYGALFGLLLKTNRGIDNFVGFVIIGITVFSVMNKMMMAGNGLMEANRSLIQAFTFPRSAIVFAQSLRYIYDIIPSIICAVLIALAFQVDKIPSWTVILIVPIFILVVTFGTGLMFVTSSLTALVPDFRVLFEVGARGWMFVSGVFFSIDRFANDPLVHRVMTANPAYIYIDSARDVVMRGSTASPEIWFTMIAWSLGVFSVGFLQFWFIETKSGKIE